jgi:hypothetical protein
LFLLNSDLSPKYTALQLRNSYSSVNSSFENVVKFRNFATTVANHKWSNGEIKNGFNSVNAYIIQFGIFCLSVCCLKT